jgi:hypothetical protein
MSPSWCLLVHISIVGISLYLHRHPEGSAKAEGELLAQTLLVYFIYHVFSRPSHLRKAHLQHTFGRSSSWNFLGHHTFKRNT